jgi:hypothetical protein
MTCQNKHCVMRVPVSQSFRNTPGISACVRSPSADEQWRLFKDERKPTASTSVTSQCMRLCQKRIHWCFAHWHTFHGTFSVGHGQQGSAHSALIYSCDRAMKLTHPSSANVMSVWALPHRSLQALKACKGPLLPAVNDSRPKNLQCKYRTKKNVYCFSIANVP